MKMKQSIISIVLIALTLASMFLPFATFSDGRTASMQEDIKKESERRDSAIAAYERDLVNPKKTQKDLDKDIKKINDQQEKLDFVVYELFAMYIDNRLSKNRESLEELYGPEIANLKAAIEGNKAKLDAAENAVELTAAIEADKAKLDAAENAAELTAAIEADEAKLAELIAEADAKPDIVELKAAITADEQAIANVEFDRTGRAKIKDAQAEAIKPFYEQYLLEYFEIDTTGMDEAAVSEVLAGYWSEHDELYEAYLISFFEIDVEAVKQAGIEAEIKRLERSLRDDFARKAEFEEAFGLYLLDEFGVNLMDLAEDGLEAEIARLKEEHEDLRGEYLLTFAASDVETVKAEALKAELNTYKKTYGYMPLTPVLDNLREDSVHAFGFALLPGHLPIATPAQDKADTATAWDGIALNKSIINANSNVYPVEAEIDFLVKDVKITVTAMPEAAPVAEPAEGEEPAPVLTEYPAYDSEEFAALFLGKAYPFTASAETDPEPYRELVNAINTIGDNAAKKDYSAYSEEITVRKNGFVAKVQVSYERVQVAGEFRSLYICIYAAAVLLVMTIAFLLAARDKLVSVFYTLASFSNLAVIPLLLYVILRVGAIPVNLPYSSPEINWWIAGLMLVLPVAALFVNIKSVTNTKRTMIYVLCIAFSILSLLPFWIMIVNATRNSQEIQGGVSLIPSNFLGHNWMVLETKDFNILTGFKNSFIIAVGSTLLNVYFSALTAYGLSVYKFRGSKLLYALVLAIIMIPGQVTGTGFYMFMYQINWTNSYLPLIIPAIASASTVFFFKQYLEANFQVSLVEASRIDGAGEFYTFNRIIVPIMIPAMATMGIMAMIGSWNNYLTPLMLLSSDSMKTLPMMVKELRGDIYRTEYGSIYLGLTLTALPLLIVYFLCSKYIIAGVAVGGVKE